ncbi:MAG: response regulator transcription factor, partial [Chloroflexia bacterium]|nr:response regulator transcription factor [Chloroflexia bacterium]
MAQHCILVVDDEPAIRLFLSDELAEAGYSVLTAASGEEALRLSAEEEVDLVLLDLRMPGLGGLQVLEQINNLALSPEVIILTAYGTLDSAIAALRRGATDYLLKPCRSSELLDSVARGLARRTQAQRRQALLRTIADSAQQLQLPDSPKATAPDPSRLAKTVLVEARGLLVEPSRMQVTRLGEPLELTATEFKLLLCLMERADRPLSFAEMAYVLYETVEDEAVARQSLST